VRSNRLPPLWTTPQRAVVAGAVAILLAYLAVRLLLNPLHVSDPQPDVPSRYDELADKIDPNTANANTLAALPGLGPARARDIVAYRESFKHADPTRRPFETPEDLLKVKGIGVSMLETMRPYLHFAATQRATQPATQPATAP
jgi:competence ComEA-like helix-hairpin-helix protein